jgi:DNA-binding LacI/PurR family transcriptional regulator
MELLNKTKQLEDYLRHEIRKKRWAIGKRMPSEEKLIQAMKVSRPTMREALNTLASEGIIQRRHGAGTFIKRIPTGRIVVFVLFENLTSPMGYWYHDLVEALRLNISTNDLKIELAVGHGETIPEVIKSFERLFQQLPMAEIEGGICLTSLPGLKELLIKYNIHGVSASLEEIGLSGSVVLDYMKLTKLAARCMKQHGHDDFTLMYVDDSVDKLGNSLYKLLEECHLVAVDGDRSRLLPIPNIDEAYSAFKEWWQSSDRPDSIFFFDGSLFDCASQAMLEFGIKIPEELAVMTHANTGRQFNTSVDVARIGFDPDLVVNSICKLLRKRKNSKYCSPRTLKISPILTEGKSL